MKVGLDLIKIKGKERKFAYRDIPYSPLGWINAKDYLPADYDLMFLIVEDNPNHLCGWSVGSKWDGLSIKPYDKVLYWKRRPNEDKRKKQCKADLQ